MQVAGPTHIAAQSQRVAPHGPHAAVKTARESFEALHFQKAASDTAATHKTEAARTKPETAPGRAQSAGAPEPGPATLHETRTLMRPGSLIDIRA
jgi:hypothetical protein